MRRTAQRQVERSSQECKTSLELLTDRQKCRKTEDQMVKPKQAEISNLGMEDDDDDDIICFIESCNIVK